MSNRNRIVIAVVASGLFCVLTVSPAEAVHAAARGAKLPSITLQYPSADLDAPRGVARLYRRIHEAAKAVCGPYDSVFMEQKQSRDQCVNQAVSRAVLSVHSEKLSAYHWRRIGRRQRPIALAAR
jgi:UrcA family protein